MAPKMNGTAFTAQTTHANLTEELANKLFKEHVEMELKEEDSSTNELMGKVQTAYWYFLTECGVTKKQVDFLAFAKEFVGQLAQLSSLVKDLEKKIETFKKMEKLKATCGIIMLNKALDKVLMVQNYKLSTAYKHQRNIGFPKGKIEKKESEKDCAIRETMEETSFDATNYIRNVKFEYNLSDGRRVVVFVATDVEMEFNFKPARRGEIEKETWFPIKSLPSTLKDDEACKDQGVEASSFYVVLPIVDQLKKFVEDLRRQQGMDPELPVPKKSAHDMPYWEKENMASVKMTSWRADPKAPPKQTLRPALASWRRDINPPIHCFDHNRHPGEPQPPPHRPDRQLLHGGNLQLKSRWLRDHSVRVKGHC